MLQWISHNREWLFSGIGVSLIVLFPKFWKHRPISQRAGGAGGNAQIIMGEGEAQGGKGGTGGGTFGPGGKGGNARIIGGKGKAVGGEGGSAG